MAETFTTTLQQADDKNATGIRIPSEVIAALSTQKRPKVKVTVNGYTYRNTVAVFGDVFMVGVNQEHRAAAGLTGGDQIEVTIELDTEPRTVEIPEDLRAALSERAGATEAFDKVAFSRRKEFVRQVEDAKTQETRERRIAKIVAELGNSG
ncbi:MAG: YdeI/OmpD-associated family protein [Chloroflexia bacterium]